MCAADGPGRLIDLLSPGGKNSLDHQAVQKIAVDIGADVTLRRITNYFCQIAVTLAK